MGRLAEERCAPGGLTVCSMVPTITSIECVIIYVDEIKEQRNRLGELWTYIGVLIIPTKYRRRAQKALQTDRISAAYEGEVHFTELKNFSYAHRYNEKTLLARKWLERVLNDRDKIFHFNLLGINLTNLQYDAFGRRPKQRRLAIYNRFLRPAILFPVQYFFSGQGIQVTDLYHDQTELGQHEWFKRSVIAAINESRAPVHFFNTYRIQFIDSDHRKERYLPRESHFMQLCDVLTGATTQVLDDRTGKDGCNELAEIICPLVACLADETRHKRPGGAFHHAHRLYMSFFPSHRLTAAQLEDPAGRDISNFYVNRPLLWSPERLVE
jgi:hypothetical protein